MDPQRYNHLNVFLSIKILTGQLQAASVTPAARDGAFFPMRPADIPTLLWFESLGLLVLLGFDIAALTPVAYQRRSLRRPSRDISS